MFWTLQPILVALLHSFKEVSMANHFIKVHRRSDLDLRNSAFARHLHKLQLTMQRGSS